MTKRGKHIVLFWLVVMTGAALITLVLELSMGVRGVALLWAIWPFAWAFAAIFCSVLMIIIIGAFEWLWNAIVPPK